LLAISPWRRALFVAIDVDHGTGASPFAGTDYDQVAVGTGTGNISTGSVILGGSDLMLTIGLNGVQENDRFFILTNDGTDRIPDTFNNLPDKGFLVVGTQIFQISYDANATTGSFTGGNDIALIAVPEIGSSGLMLLARPSDPSPPAPLVDAALSSVARPFTGLR
jgi:hypothetical protein